MPTCPSNELHYVAACCLDSAHDGMLRSAAGQIALDSAYMSSNWWRYSGLTRTRFNHPGIEQADGYLAHPGRQDFQVMVRPLLIGLAETERVLSAAPGFPAVLANIGERVELRASNVFHDV